jgi:hypothetical protein
MTITRGQRIQFLHLRTGIRYPTAFAASPLRRDSLRMKNRDGWIQRFDDSTIQGFGDSRIRGFKDSTIQGFEDSRIQGLGIARFTISDQ